MVWLLTRYKAEFQWKKLGLGCEDEVKQSFYQSSCARNPKAFFVYRFMTFGYAVAMTIWFQVYLRNEALEKLAISHLYFTNWGDIASTVYFFLAAVLSLVGGVMEYDNKFVTILRGGTWIFSSISSSAQILLTPIYWSFPPCEVLVECFYKYLNIHRHGIILFVIFFDRLTSAFPTRLLHFVYPMLFATIYVTVSGVGHSVGGVPPVYQHLDWTGYPGRTAALMLTAAWLGPILAQHVWLLVYAIWSKYVSCNSDAKDVSEIEHCSVV